MGAGEILTPPPARPRGSTNIDSVQLARKGKIYTTCRAPKLLQKIMVRGAETFGNTE